MWLMILQPRVSQRAKLWCLSMVILFIDVLIIRNKYPTEFKREQLVPNGVFVAASIFGAIASGVGIWVTLSGSWNPALIPNGPWLFIVGGVAVLSLLVAVLVFFLGPGRRPTAAQPVPA